MCGIGQKSDKEEAIDRLVGLERLDVAEDGSLSCEDLTGALSGVGELKASDVCIAASEEGVFLIGAGLEGLLPDGAAHTDTFFLRRDAEHFEPYPKTLSFAPLELPKAVYSDGWLYAYATSKFEAWPVFGRATHVADNPEPGPEPEPKPVNPDKPGDDKTPSKRGLSATTKSTSSNKLLAKTGDDPAQVGLGVALLAIVGCSCVAFGMRRRSAIR